VFKRIINFKPVYRKHKLKSNWQLIVKTSTKHFLLAFAIFLLLESKAQKQPNILLILSDDAGYADFGFQGSTDMKTPRLDKLASEGIVFQQAYVTAAVCGPSRAGLLTGMYQQRFGFEENNVPGYMDNAICMNDDDMGLPTNLLTMGDYLKALGYNTGYFGKWHMGNADRFHPTKRGFDVFHGFRGGARSYYDFCSENPNYRNEDWLEHGYGKYYESEKYLTNELADQAIDFIQSVGDNPFFAILAFNAVHSPMEAEPELLKEFPSLSGKRQILAAMTLSMDRAIGRVLDKLSELGFDENTLIVYTNDNGGPTDDNSSSNLPLSGTKANHLEGGIRVPTIFRWKNNLPEKSTFSLPVSTLDLLPTFVNCAGGKADSIKNLDGVDLMPYLLGKMNNRPHQTLYWKKENRGAIRDGDWKMLRFPDRPEELYNLANDISETENLADHYPEMVRKMYRQLFDWECTLARPQWQLQRKYEKAAMERMDKYRVKAK